jgi:hypothetical protein
MVSGYPVYLRQFQHYSKSLPLVSFILTNVPDVINSLRFRGPKWYWNGLLSEYFSYWLSPAFHRLFTCIASSSTLYKISSWQLRETHLKTSSSLLLCLIVAESKRKKIGWLLYHSACSWTSRDVKVQVYFTLDYTTKAQRRSRWGWMVNATPRPLYTLERPGNHCIGGWVGLWAGLEGCGNSRPPLEFDPRTVQSVTSRYTVWAIAVFWNSWNRQ